VLIAEVDPRLPWLGGSATVAPEFFDAVVTPPGPYPKLFGLPRQPVTDADYAIGFHASTLVVDGGTLQIGIGALADALCHALVLRHVDNEAYRNVLRALGSPHAGDEALAPFERGLYGCSEMINEGFRRLVEVGVIKRRVVDDLAAMQRIERGGPSAHDLALLEQQGEFLHGAFYLGSPAFYEWLRDLPPDTRRAIGMRRVGEVNDLVGDIELERLQRRDARFFNTCMMATALGAATSDALEDGRVVSGVGGQYNFVAMSHALPDARSTLMLRATRESAGNVTSNIVWNYGHTTIPRHLRDVYISEYGIADIRGKTDEDCAIAMAAIADARFQQGLVDIAKREGKLRDGFALPASASRNTPERLAASLRPFHKSGALPDYPLGSDFTPVEQRLVKALAWLKANTATRGAKLKTVWRALSARTDDSEALERMGLSSPSGFGERLEAKLVSLALAATR